MKEIDIGKAKETVANEELRKAKLKAAPTKMKEIPQAVGVPIPKRCVLKCRNKPEMVIVTQEGGMLFLCSNDAELLKEKKTIPQHRIPTKPKRKK
jgi:hypothetical protein